MATTKKDKKVKEDKATSKTTKAEKKVVEETTTEPEVVEKKVVRSRQQTRKAIKKQADNITIYIVNLSPNQVKFTYKDNDVFDLKEEGDEADVTLDEFSALKNGHKGYFEKHHIAITDIDCDGEDDFELEEILEYLGISDVYDNIENYDIDYIKYILTKMDAYDLEKLLATCDDALAERIAERAVKMLKKGKFDSIRKQKLITDRLGLEELIY
ncbi:MAG: hypothetical protein ACRCX2_36065 [Paraclostridium sp.]